MDMNKYIHISSVKVKNLGEMAGPLSFVIVRYCFKLPFLFFCIFLNKVQKVEGRNQASSLIIGHYKWITNINHLLKIMVKD